MSTGRFMQKRNTTRKSNGALKVPYVCVCVSGVVSGSPKNITVGVC